MLGHSYFMTIQDDEDLEFVKKYKLKAVLDILNKKEKYETI